LQDVSLMLNKNDFILLLGPNGAGKSTLLKVLLGEIKPSEGLYYLDETNMIRFSKARIAHLVGRVYQDPNSGIFPNLSIRENLKISCKKGIRGFRFSKFSEESLILLKELGLGLEKKLDHFAGELSGGQKQALAMVMAIASRPRILLLDEHTASLDPKSVIKVMELTEKINREMGVSVLMITHNMDFVGNFGNRLFKVSEGSVYEENYIRN